MNASEQIKSCETRSACIPFNFPIVRQNAQVRLRRPDHKTDEDASKHSIILIDLGGARMITSTSATPIQPRRDNSRRRAAIWLCQNAYAQLHRSTHATDEDVSRHRITLHMLFEDVLTRLFFVSSLGWTMFANRNRLSQALLQGVMLGWRQKYTRLMSGTRTKCTTIVTKRL